MTLRNITDALTACGLDLPAEAARWVEIRDAIRTAAEQRQVEAVETAVAGLNPETAAETIDRLTRQRLEQQAAAMVARQLVEAAGNRAASTARAAATEIIEQARPAFDAAVATIAEHAGAFDHGENPEAILSRGTAAAEAWQSIREASAVLDAHAALWSDLYERPANIEAVAATLDGDHWRRVDGDELLGGPNRWHALVAADYELRLNTYAEAMAVLAATPERELRQQMVPLGAGKYGMQLVRQ